MYKKETIRIHKAWKEVKRYVKKWDDKLYYKNAKQLVSNIKDFRELYKSAKGTGNIVQTIKSTLRYKTSLKTAKALKEASSRYITGRTKKGTARKRALRYVKKEITDKSLTELRNMSTRDIAESFKDDIKKMYHDLRAHGLDATEASKEISAFYFGS